MRARSPDLHGDIDISALPSVLKRKAGKLALAAVAVGVLVYGALLPVPSRYTSEAQIRIGAPSSHSDAARGPASAESVAISVDREAIASRVQELRSPDLAKKLVSELHLATRPEFNSAVQTQGVWSEMLHRLGLAGPRPGETEEERVLAAYYRALQVYQVKDTRVISLSFTARDGDLAAHASNRLIELYQAWLRERGVTETSDANAWLVPEIAKRTRELSAAEATVERFRATANLYRGGGNQPGELAQQQLVDLASEMTKVRAQRSEAEARAQAARELMRRDAPDAIPEVQKSPVMQGLIAERVRVERNYAEAATQLLPAHPRMKQLAANVTDVRRQIQREAGAVVSGLEREVTALALREGLQKRTLDEAKAGLGSTADDRVRLAQLEDEVRAKRNELEGLRQRYEASRSRGTSQAVPVEVQVIATARPSSLPSWPNRLQIALLAAATTFVLGLVAVMFRELLSAGSRKSWSSPETSEEIPVRGVTMPAAGLTGAPTTAAAVAASPVVAAQMAAPVHQSPARLTSVAALADRLMSNAAGQSGYRTLVVGDAGARDAPMQSVELANALARAGRQVVLVDWSLDGVGLSEILGLPASPGFTDLLTGGASFEDVIRVLPESATQLVPCGRVRPEGIESLDPDRMHLLLDALDEAYTDVIITGSHEAVRDLFRVIEGRVDAGVVVSSGDNDDAAAYVDAGLQFLGFDVIEIDVIRLEEVRAAPAKRIPGWRVSRGVAMAPAASTAT